MGVARKLERKKIKSEWKRSNRGVQKRYRNFFNKFWEDYQDKKYGKENHKLIVRICSKRKKNI